MFDFNARAAWIYINTVMTDDLVAKARKYGIKVIYIDVRRTDAKNVISFLTARGFIVGAYFASSWTEAGGAAFADYISAELNALMPRTSGVHPCMLDFEEKPIAWVDAALVRYRQHQPGRPTSLTDEPFQGGVLDWNQIKTAGMPYYPQVYHGDMSLADAAAVVLEAARYYGDPKMVHPFYSGEHFGTDQRDGCYFTLERMP